MASAIEGMTSQSHLIEKAVRDAQKSAANSTELTMTDFYELMAAQLKYQDMDNPADTSQMMATMVQSQMIQAITNMAATNTTSYAASLVGKEVTIAKTDADGNYDGDFSGIVSSVILGDDPIVMVDGGSYKLSQIVAIGVVSEGEAADGEGSDNAEGDTSEGNTTE